MSIQRSLVFLIFLMLISSFDSQAQSGKNCYACRVIVHPTSNSNFPIITRSDSPVCVVSGEDPERLVLEEVKRKRHIDMSINSSYVSNVTCVDQKRRAELINFDINDPRAGANGLEYFASDQFIADRKQGSQSSAKALSASQKEDKNDKKKLADNMTHCISLAPNAHYGEFALANSCGEDAEAAFCYLGSKSKLFECDPKRKEGWQRGIHAIQPGGKRILPDSTSGHKIIWYACEKGRIPKIVGYDQRIKKPIGQCK